MTHECKATYDRRHLFGLIFERLKFWAKVNSRAIQENVEDGMSRTGVVAQLVCKPDLLCSWIVKVCRTVGVFAPEKAKYETILVEMVHCPWLDTVDLDELYSTDAKPPHKRGEDTWRVVK